MLIAAIALTLSFVGVVAAVAWLRSREQYRELAERIDVDARIEYLTTQALINMRDAARERMRGDGRRF
jgi:hypothetical protein